MLPLDGVEGVEVIADWPGLRVVRSNTARQHHADQLAAVANERARTLKTERTDLETRVEVEIVSQGMPLGGAELDHVGLGRSVGEPTAGVGHTGERATLHVGDDHHDPEQVSRHVDDRLGPVGVDEGLLDHVHSALGRAVQVQQPGDAVGRETPLAPHFHGRQPPVTGHPVDGRGVDVQQLADLLGREQGDLLLLPVLHALHVLQAMPDGRIPPRVRSPPLAGPKVLTCQAVAMGSGHTTTGRDLRALPKAHLHLHFTGAMRHDTMIDLADRHHVRLPEALRDHYPPHLSAADERGWFRFQRLYDTARSVLQQPSDLYRLLREVAEDEVADGSRWLEIQVDPSGYAHRFGGLTATLELVLDAAGQAAAGAGIGIGVIVGANRTRHPLDSRTLARLAAAHAGRGVVGFGLANDERRGDAADFERAFRIARDAGLPGSPHGGELLGAASVRSALDSLQPSRIGHGVRSVEDPSLLQRLADEAITLEVCPASNVSLGVYQTLDAVPVRTLFDAGVALALGADDPLLFGSRLATQYEIARAVHGFSDVELAELARMSVRGSFATDSTKAAILADIDSWLASPVELP